MGDTRPHPVLGTRYSVLRRIRPIRLPRFLTRVGLVWLLIAMTAVGIGMYRSINLLLLLGCLLLALWPINFLLAGRRLRRLVARRRVRVEDSLSDYVLDLVAATREHPDVYLGASTRAGLSLYRAAQALAVIEGRDYVVPDDVKRLAGPVLAHRLLAKASRQGGRVDAAEAVVADIAGRTALPV